MQGVNDSAKEIVLSYIRALDNRDYDLAKNYLSESVRVVGPAGEAFRNPSEFIEMLRKFSGRYYLKKVF